MKKASIISVGNEILSGRTVDANCAYLSARLLSMGIPVVSAYTSRDDTEAIVRSLELACADADVVVTTGGLGPTEDDLTRNAVAEFLGVELEIRPGLVAELERFFVRRGLRMPERNRIQAYVPAGAEPIENSLGTAPGIRVETKGKLLFVLPGVPSEMKGMFEGSVVGQVEQFGGGQFVVVKRLRCFGAGESTIAEMVGGIMERGRNPLVNCTVNQDGITLDIVATSENREMAAEMAAKDEEVLRARLGDLVFGTGEQILGEVVGQELSRQGKTLAVAESCTGGLVAKLLTDVAGASRYFRCGWVTYDNRAKMAELGVGAELIERYGAVSEEVSRAMAAGARREAGVDFAIGITGIAGPTGATEQKPVGLVYISVDFHQGCDTKRCTFPQDRASVRRRAALTALNMVRLKLKA
ncbi:MAG: competence/damage-inducible protein A [Phycisphaerales bacterium]|nr:MAG: competence/damage-inducible protein A [Phycisphaerales bacterium]